MESFQTGFDASMVVGGFLIGVAIAAAVVATFVRGILGYWQDGTTKLERHIQSVVAEELDKEGE